jgi:hypothetical protein
MIRIIWALPKGQAFRYIFFLPFMAAKKRMPLQSLTRLSLMFQLKQIVLSTNKEIPTFVGIGYI